jgi:hypothetical protein
MWHSHKGTIKITAFPLEEENLNVTGKIWFLDLFIIIYKPYLTR